MKNTQLAIDIVIGILGEYYNNQPCLSQEGIIDVDADRSVARRIRGTPNDAAKNFGTAPSRGDPGAHSGGAGALRCIDHTRGRFVVCPSLTLTHVQF
jgi:hypothetical protein